MDGTSFMSVDEVAQTLGVSKSYAYKIVHQLNAELKAEGYLTISGRVNYREYFKKQGMFENEVYAGIHDLLTELKAKDKSLIVATS